MSLGWYIDSILIFTAILILSLSLFSVSKIIRELSLGTLKRLWITLRILIFLFIVGYIAYWFNIPHKTQNESVIVSIVFFLGAIFVFSVSWLMLQTTRDIKRVAKLELQSITDPLVGIYNRRYLDQRLTEEINRARRYKFPLSLLLLDIDHFKQINDRFGHLAGDKVLSQIGNILRENTRENDIAARYGGEELVIVLPNTPEEMANKLAERIRIILEQTFFEGVQNNAEELRCTISIGVSSLKEGNFGANEMFRQADIALYRAKKMGRNRVVIYSTEYEELATN